MKILVLDIGGTHVNALATGHRQRVEFPSGPKLAEAEHDQMLQAATAAAKQARQEA